MKTTSWLKSLQDFHNDWQWSGINQINKPLAFSHKIFYHNRRHGTRTLSIIVSLYHSVSLSFLAIRMRHTMRHSKFDRESSLHSKSHPQVYSLLFQWWISTFMRADFRPQSPQHSLSTSAQHMKFRVNIKSWKSKVGISIKWEEAVFSVTQVNGDLLQDIWYHKNVLTIPGWRDSSEVSSASCSSRDLSLLISTHSKWFITTWNSRFRECGHSWPSQSSAHIWHICVYMCIYIYVYMHTYVYLHIYLYKQTHIYTYSKKAHSQTHTKNKISILVFKRVQSNFY